MLKSPEVIRCPSCGAKRKRSNPANARYWLLLHLMADKITPAGASYTPETWHAWAKSRFLGCEEVRLPNGKTLQVPKSSADLSTEEFNTLMAEVEMFAQERGVYMDEMETLK